MPWWAIVLVAGVLTGCFVFVAALLDVSGPDPLQRRHEDDAQR